TELRPATASPIRSSMATSVPTPKFVSLRGILVYELRNRKDTSKSMILVWLLVQKSALTTRGNNGADFLNRHTSVPIPKFVSLRGILVYELRNRKDTNKSMILVWLLFFFFFKQKTAYEIS